MRQRSKLLFLAEGDANTKLFHLQACHRNRKSIIASIKVEGMELVHNEEMAEALFNHFVAILGQPFQRRQNIDLQAIGIPSTVFQQLDGLFSEQEVWETISELPADKAPGPDGFSGLFYKLAWPTIKADIMRAFNAFWARDFRSFSLVNEAHLILLRKKENPEEIKDYRPISLIHSFAKLVTKCLANRLRRVLDSLVRPNQSAFISGRCLHDNFRSVQLTCRYLHSTRRPSLLLKVDLAKAFDTVSWPFLLHLLVFMGFSQRWRDWLSALLSTATSRILLNGRPGTKIIHARGLRQGDPLSLMLFVLVMEVLNGLVNCADRNGFLAPLPSKVAGTRVSLCADDAALFLLPGRQDVAVLKEILAVFADATGLSTNLDKCVATPIRCSSDQVEEFRGALGCRVSDFPCRYLGIPLSVYKLKRTEEQARSSTLSRREFQHGKETCSILLGGQRWPQSPCPPFQLTRLWPFVFHHGQCARLTRSAVHSYGADRTLSLGDAAGSRGRS
jgi:hypothetical protein